MTIRTGDQDIFHLPFTENQKVAAISTSLQGLTLTGK